MDFPEFYLVNFITLKYTNKEKITLPFRIDIFSTVANDVIMTIKNDGKGVFTSKGKAKGNKTWVDPPGLVCPAGSYLVIYVAFEHDPYPEIRKKGWCLQGSVAEKINLGHIGGQIFKLSEASKGSQEKIIDSGIEIYLDFRKPEPNDLQFYSPDWKRSYTINEPFRSFEKITQIANETKSDERKVSDGEDPNEVHVYYTDWASGLPLPLWKTDVFNTIQWDSGLLKFLMRSTRPWVNLDPINDPKASLPLKVETCLRWIQLAVQLFVNSICFTDDLKFEYSKGNREVTSQILLNPVLYGTGDCEDFASLSRSLFSALLEHIKGSTRDNEGDVSRILQSVHGFNTPLSMVFIPSYYNEDNLNEDQVGEFHCSCIAFYECEGKMMWCGLDGCNPRMSLGEDEFGRAQGEHITSIQERIADDFLAKYNNYDVRYEMWDHRNSSWSKEVQLIEDIEPNKLTFYLSKKSDLDPHSRSKDQDKLRLGVWLHDRDIGTISKSFFDKDMSQLWRFKPNPVFTPSEESMRLDLIKRTTEKKADYEDHLFVCRIHYNSKLGTKDDTVHKTMWNELTALFSEEYNLTLSSLKIGALCDTFIFCFYHHE